jgi:hypothetical protein
MKRARHPALPLLAFLASSASLACSQPSLTTCDITQRSCQEDIYYKVLSLRGDAMDPFDGLPPVTVISEDAYRATLEQDAAAAAKNGPNPWDKALLLLHFTSDTSAPGDGGAGADGGTGNSTIDDQVTHVYAFYDPPTKTVTIISHPDQTSSDDRQQAMITLAHELVHSLQDREIDLNKQDFASSDNYFAWDSMIEGDARFYEYRFENDLLRLGYPQSDMVAMPNYELNYVYTHFDQAGAPLFAAKLLVYALGAKYLATAYDSGGNAAVRHAYAQAPTRTVGFLVGDDGRVPPVGTGKVCPAPVALSLVPTDKTTGTDQFGALLLYTFLRGWNVDHDTAFATAQTWTGDFLRVQASSDFATSAAAWRIEFSAIPPSSIVQALTATGELTVTPSANALLITVSDATTPLVWSATASCP